MSAVLLEVLIAMTTIIVTARIVGLVFARLGQPPVMGEVVGGILLGPSFLGGLAPDLAARLVPPAAVPALGWIALVGVILYMFFIGLELDYQALRGRLKTTATVSATSIVLPFSLGAILAIFLASSYEPPNTSFLSFVLFLGTSMSITAFPVLARILSDRGLQKTRMGVIALTCAAVDDATAWTLLAIVMMITQSHAGTAATTRSHLIFAAFLIGALIPHQSAFAQKLDGRIAQAVRVFLLPAFFAFTGMRTQIGLMQTATDWLWCGAIIAIATAGKFGGATIAARFSGLDWRDSAALGILMNTRGLVELIVLNIGLDSGVLSPRLFTMLVIMALVTTLMTPPILAALLRRRPWT